MGYGRQVGKAVWTALGTSLNVNPHAAIEEDPVVTAIHNNAEKFDPMTEAVFRYIQIFTAICDSFAHGANDVANAMGPFMAIYAIYNDGGVSKEVAGAILLHFARAPCAYAQGRSGGFKFRRG